MSTSHGIIIQGTRSRLALSCSWHIRKSQASTSAEHLSKGKPEHHCQREWLQALEHKPQVLIETKNFKSLSVRVSSKTVMASSCSHCPSQHMQCAHQAVAVRDWAHSCDCSLW